MRSSIIGLAGIASAMPAPSNLSSLRATNINIPDGIRPPSTAGFHEPMVMPSRGGKSICVSGIVPVHAVSSQIIKIAEDQVPTNQTAVTNMEVESFSAGTVATTPDYMTVDDTFNIGASLCVSANDTKSIPTTVQLLTHGVGFDRFYWDFAEGYSYVDSSTEAGYAVFLYDRLGIGASEHPDPRIVQMQLDISILHSLTMILRAGTLSNTTFKTIIGVGHSFGSAITTNMNVAYPTTFNATVVTGTGPIFNNTQPAFTWGMDPTIASASDPARFGDLPIGYFCPATASGMQFDFFRAPGFDGTILAQAFAQRQTMTIGDMFSGGAVSHVAKNYTNPVFVMNGKNDWPFCQGNCSAPMYHPSNVRTDFYPNVKEADFGTYLAPVAGHGVNLHYSAERAYAVILKFLKQHGF